LNAKGFQILDAMAPMLDLIKRLFENYSLNPMLEVIHQMFDLVKRLFEYQIFFISPGKKLTG
jgi:hypothetical protein